MTKNTYIVMLIKELAKAPKDDTMSSEEVARLLLSVYSFPDDHEKIRGELEAIRNAATDILDSMATIDVLADQKGGEAIAMQTSDLVGQK